MLTFKSADINHKLPFYQDQLGGVHGEFCSTILEGC